MSHVCCLVFAAVQLVASAVVVCRFGIGETISSPDPQEIQNFRSAQMMLVTAVLLEACYLVSASGNIPGVQLHGYQQSFLVLLQLVKKMVAYSAMARGNGVLVHVNMRAFGPQRGCYTVRYMDWTIAVPLLVTISNYPLAADRPPNQFAKLMAPNLVISAAYVVTSWVAQVTKHATAGWFLIALAFMGYLFSAVDQFYIVRELHAGVTQQRKFKVAMIALQQMVWLLYGVVYLLGIFNVVDSLAEQTFYTYGDVVLKVAQACLLVMVRNWEDLATIQTALEGKVSRSREDMSVLIRKANAPILSMDMEGCIRAWNQHLARVSRISEADALGKHLPDLVQLSCRGPLVAAIEACRQGLTTSAVELSLQAPGTASEDVQLVMSFVMQLGGDSSSIVGVGQDITELVAMKTVQARKAVIAAMVGHELRSPLHGIMGLSAAMAEAATSKALKKQLTMIQGCAGRLLDLVMNIMEMAKSDKELEKGERVVPPAGEVNFMDIADEVIGMTCAAVDKSGKPLLDPKVKIVNNLGTGTLPMVRGDAYKCTQLVYNLVTNACKFTKQGTVSFACRHDEEHSMLEVDIADTGMGISQGALERIFEPFEQEDKKEASKFQGIGLGLSVVMNIVKLHRGTISVQSTPGEGTTFTVRLPCNNHVRVGATCKPPAEEAAAEPKVHGGGAGQDIGQGGPAGSAGIAATSQGGPTFPAVDASPTQDAPIAHAVTEAPPAPLLLSVDDSEVNQEVIERTLGSTYRIVRSMNGEDALSYLASGKELPSVILLDVMMPGITGFKVCSEVREKFKLGHLALPIVMISARSPYEDTALESFRCGATDHVQKPCSVNMLRLRLAVLVKMQRELSAMGCQQPAGSFPTNLSGPPAVEAPDEGEDVLEVLRRALAERDELQARLDSVVPAPIVEGEAVRRDALQHDGFPAHPDAERPLLLGDPTLPVSTEPPPPPDETVGVPRELGQRPEHTAQLQEKLETAWQDMQFLRAELEQRDLQIRELCEQLWCCKSEVWLTGGRAEALDRELRHVLSRHRAAAAHTTPGASP